jgi:hypothetical protein
MDSKEDKARRARAAAAKKAASVNVPRRGFSPHAESEKKPSTSADWSFWGKKREALAWEACALSFNLNPDRLEPLRDGWMAGPGAGPLFEPRSFPSKATADEFGKRLRLLGDYVYDREYFDLLVAGESAGRCKIRLWQFAAWCERMEFDDLPPELLRLTRDSASSEQKSKGSGMAVNSHPVTSGAVGVNSSSTAASNGDWRDKAREIADEFFDRDTAGGTRDALLTKKARGEYGGYAARVMDEMQKREIHGPRGRIDNPRTIAREALQGDKWWSRKPK